ncbi:autoinducer binding domain-containing protein [Sphingomonas donggukensis]|uniref:Autoinducer binding domain-containing protein n=1 Tax=Sphingomonas donggukensis TaxID=2949093 RepID=A0ABY4TVJ5_9SPHN|nr:autoinducer binding domain-containing protein [Sphingomonas donggukensis]URW75895.1 autoinducer binding domain-containing protein [Sphingomonas donggukensis]
MSASCGNYSHFIGNKQNIFRKSREEFARDWIDHLQRRESVDVPSKISQSTAVPDVVAGLRQSLAGIGGTDDAGRLLIAAAAALGFDYLALAEHGDLSDTQRSLALISNYPASWQKVFVTRRLDRIDPVQQACQTQVSGFCWSALNTLIALRPEQSALLSESRHYGLGAGFTVPLHLPGARAASCSFAVRAGAVLPRESLWAADLVARMIFDHLRAAATPTRPTRLSPRQRACVALMAAGLTDRGIARRLSLSEETVTKYLNAARRRYGLARRTQLVAAALRDGVIGYEDLALD